MKDENSFEEPEKQLGELASEGQSSAVFQPYPDTCAIRCQEIILQEFGYKTDHDKLLERSIEIGAFEPGVGTHPDKVGKLFDEFGVAYRQTENGNIYNIIYELSHGHRVIVGVSSEELSHHGLFDLEDILDNHEADHTLIVTGIDYSDPDQVMVNLKDPGTGDIAKAYPMDEFVDAWRHSNCFMVSTMNAPEPELDLPQMRYFDEEIGHLEKIGELPYENFKEIYDGLNEINFKRVNGWNELCDDLSETIKGEEDFEHLQQTLENYIAIESDAKKEVEEIFEGTEFVHEKDDILKDADLEEEEEEEIIENPPEDPPENPLEDDDDILDDYEPDEL